MNTPITAITISTFLYYSPLDEADMHICAKCAAANPQFNPTPITFTYDLANDTSSPLCHNCDDLIIGIA